MDGDSVILLGGFITTWVQIAMLYAKVSKIEGEMKGLNSRVCNLDKRLNHETERIDNLYKKL